MANTAQDSSLTRLFDAIENEDLEAIRELMSTGQVDVNESDDEGQTALYVAKGNADIVRILLEDPKFNVNKAHGQYATPLNYSAFEGHTEVARLLLENPNIDVNKANMEDATPFCYAAFKGHTEVVRLLLEIPNIDVNKADIEDSTPLNHAAFEGDIEVVRLLLENP
eukprot:171918_1